MLRGFLIGRCLGRAIEHAHDVAFFHDQKFDAVELDLGAGPFSEQHLVADPEIDRDDLAGLIGAAWAHGGDFASLRLFLRRVGDDDPAGSLRFSINTLDNDAVMERAKLHPILLRNVAGILREGSGLLRAAICSLNLLFYTHSTSQTAKLPASNGRNGP